MLSYDSIKIYSSPKVNIHMQATEAEVETFCKDYNIWLPHFKEYHTMTAYLYPNASAERLIILNIFMNLLWYVDDMYDDARLDHHSDKISISQLFSIATDALQFGKTQTDAPLWISACVALHHKIGNRDSIRTLTQSIPKHLQSITNTMEDIIIDGQYNLDLYLKTRENDSGMHVAIDGIGFEHGVTIPDKILNHPIIAQAKHCTANIGGLMNDLMSYHKDEASGNHFNLIAILRRNNSLSAKEGIHGAVKIINGFIESFESCEENIPHWENDDLNNLAQLYMQALRNQIEASWHWQLATNRYRSPDAYYDKLKTSDS